MQQPIIDFITDQEDDWVALLACGHRQHVRHRPPFFNRPWVISQAGRDAHLGQNLDCKKCDAQQPVDFAPESRLKPG